MENGIGIDDYLALCEETGLVPALAVRLQLGLEARLLARELRVEIERMLAEQHFGRPAFA